MGKRLSKIILRKIKFEALCIILQVKIFLMGSFLIRRKGLKSIIALFLSLLPLLSTDILLAQERQWPWTLTGERIQITDNSRDNFTPSIATNGEFYFVVWAQKTPAGFDIYGVRIDENGKRMPRVDQDGNSLEEEILISTSISSPTTPSAPNDQLYPSVIWNGEIFFVVWQDKRTGKRSEIFGARVTPDGFVLDQEGIRISDTKSTYDQISPVLSFDGEDSLVVWQGKKNAKTWNIYFRIVPKDLEGLEEREITLLNPSSKDQASPAVAFDDDENYLILWQDKRKGRWDIWGARISKTGDPIPGPRKIASTGQSDSWSPVLSWNGDHYLALWTVTAGANESYLSGRRISFDGKPLETENLIFEKNETSKAYPSLLWDGTEFLLVWEEDPAGESKIYAASAYFYDYIGPSLSLSDSAPVYSDGKKANPSSPAIGKLGDEVLVVWQELNPDNRWNLFGQVISKPKPPEPDGGIR